MKEKWRLILSILLFIILVLLVASIIGDILALTIKDKLNQGLVKIIHIILIFIFIEILFKTKSGRYISKRIFK